MFKDNLRFCDVCADEIPKGTKYCVTTLSPEAAAAFLDVTDPDLVPTWMQNQDGTLRLDICGTCYLSMGSAKDLDEIN